VTAIYLRRAVWRKKLNELTNPYNLNSPSSKERFYWINAPSLVSPMAHYFIMIKYDQFVWIIQMMEPSHRSSVGPFPVPTSPRPSTLHDSESSRFLIAT